jgi:hypothetical protein
LVQAAASTSRTAATRNWRVKFRMLGCKMCQHEELSGIFREEKKKKKRQKQTGYSIEKKVDFYFISPERTAMLEYCNIGSITIMEIE